MRQNILNAHKCFLTFKSSKMTKVLITLGQSLSTIDNTTNPTSCAGVAQGDGSEIASKRSRLKSFRVEKFSGEKFSGWKVLEFDARAIE